MALTLICTEPTEYPVGETIPIHKSDYSFLATAAVIDLIIGLAVVAFGFICTFDLIVFWPLNVFSWAILVLGSGYVLATIIFSITRSLQWHLQQ